MRPINEIIVHCTATNPSWMADKPVEDIVKEVTRWHVEERKWSDCGYHFIISRSGEIGSARPIERTGAHCKGKNEGTIGIALQGGRGGSADDSFDEHYTPEQGAALRRLIDDLVETYGVEKITGHNDYAKKACPCFDVKNW